MRTDTLKKMADLAKSQGLDALLATSPENFAYLSGFTVPSHHILRWRHSMLLVRPDCSVSVFTVDMEASTVEKKLPGVPLTAWGEFTENSME